MTFIGGAQYSYEWDKCLFMPATFTGGAEYSYDDLQDEMLGYHRTIAQTVHIGSAFAQNEWKNDRWSFLIGGRLDKHNMMDHVIFSPRANVRFNPTKDINLRMSYSSGFRAPQAFDEDLHITAVGGRRGDHPDLSGLEGGEFAERERFRGFLSSLRPGSSEFLSGRFLYGFTERVYLGGDRP